MNATQRQRYRSAEKALFQAHGLAKEEHFVEIPSLGIRVRVQVAGKGTPLLFVHGGPNAGSTWAALVSLLPDFQCMLLDRPGCGLSEPLDVANLSASVLTHWITTILDTVLNHFGVRKAVLVGSSMGGYWTLRYTLSRPERVVGLVLEGCPALVEGMVVPAFMKSLTYPVLRWLIPRLPTTRSYARKMLRDIGHAAAVADGRISEPFIAWYVALVNDTDTMQHDVALINRVLVGGRMHPEYILKDADIQQVTIPTLWLWGEDDPFGDVDLGQRIHRGMSHSHFMGFPNSGHLPWLDASEEHAKAVRAFVLERDYAAS